MAMLVEKAPTQLGLAFVMHGLGGFKEQPHIEAVSDVLKAFGYTVVRFDTTNSFGESDGNYEDATATNYYEDLEDVLTWSHKQRWYQEPFVLVGHSLGGLSVALYAEKYPRKVKALAPLSTVVSGRLSMEAPKYHTAFLKEWKRTGWFIEPSKSKPGMIKKLKWSHMEDRLKYNLLPNAGRLTMPVLLVVGSNDDSTPPDHQRMLFDRLPGRKELHIIEGSDHSFTQEPYRDELRKVFDAWVRSLK